MVIIAHQCGEDKYPRITPDAALHSAAIGASYSEFDIRHLSDMGLAVSHDDNCRDLFGVDDVIRSMTTEEFKALKRKDAPGFGSLVLEDMLDAGVKKILFHIKEGGEVLTKILECCRRYGIEKDILVGIQELSDIKLVKDFNPEIKILCFIPDGRSIDDYLASDAEVIRIWQQWMQPELIDRIHKAGKECYVMVNGTRCGYCDDDVFASVKANGCDGVLTNFVEQAKRVLGM